ncbi:unnamed protein product [Rotaria sp. Silwood1]|nr:unnamed protein product [Rotaria sp. Silwood1]
MGTQDKYWAKEVITRAKKRDDVTNSRFIKKKINRLTNNIVQASAMITNLQVQLSTYWTQTTAGAINSNSTTMTTSSAAVNTSRIHDAVDRLEKAILKYIQHCTQHVKNMAEDKIRLAQVQAEEYKALEDFKQIATPNQWNIHLMLKSKMKQWNTKKNKNYLIAAKRVEYDLPPKFITNANFTYKIDESIISKEEAQILYDQMRQLTKEYRIQAMSLYLQAITREKEILKNEIELVMKAFKHYNDLCEKRFNLEGFLAPTIINEAQVKLTEEEYQLLKLGPRFIYNDPQTASRRRTTELAMLKLEQFIAELDIILKNLHDTPISKINRKYKPQREIISYDNLLETIQLNQYQITKCPITTEKKNYGRLVNYKIITKKSDEYMEKTEAYKCLHQNDPLPSLIDRTNKYLLNLRLSNWITQKQYEQLSIKSNEVELAHLYYLPKAHKLDTPLRPIISGLKHPTIKISKFLDELLRPLFDKMASNTTVTSGTEVIKQ